MIDLDQESDGDLYGEAATYSPVFGGPPPPSQYAPGAFGGPFAGPFRPPLQASVVPGRGVNQAILDTPRGRATLRLPEDVPTLEQFRNLEAAVNRNASRVNSVQSDVRSLSTKVGAVVSDVAKDVGKLRKEQKSQGMMTMMISLMSQQTLQRQLEGHTHDGVTVPDGSTAQPIQIGGGTNTAMLFLPLMLLGTGGDTGEDSIAGLPMMLMMMLLFAQPQAAR
jgi:hypothetical protein